MRNRWGIAPLPRSLLVPHFFVHKVALILPRSEVPSSKIAKAHAQHAGAYAVPKAEQMLLMGVFGKF